MSLRYVLARLIYESNPKGVWNNRVEPMVFEPYGWDDLDPATEHAAYLDMADDVAAGLASAGYVVVSPGSVMFPRDRKEAEAMNLISERMLKDPKAFGQGTIEDTSDGD
jgi:hypothetical protein